MSCPPAMNGSNINSLLILSSQYFNVCDTLKLLKKAYALGYRLGTCNWGVTSRLFYEVMTRCESGYNTDSRLGFCLSFVMMGARKSLVLDTV